MQTDQDQCVCHRGYISQRPTVCVVMISSMDCWTTHTCCFGGRGNAKRLIQLNILFPALSNDSLPFDLPHLTLWTLKIRIKLRNSHAFFLDMVNNVCEPLLFHLHSFGDWRVQCVLRVWETKVDPNLSFYLCIRVRGPKNVLRISVS